VTPFWWSILLTVVGIVGMKLAGRKNHWGWFIGMAAQVLWIIYATVTAQYGFYLSALLYGQTYAENWLRWRAEKRKKDASV